jgi:hypothetical protein
MIGETKLHTYILFYSVLYITTKKPSDLWDCISDDMSRLLSIQCHNIRVRLNVPWIPYVIQTVSTLF